MILPERPFENRNGAAQSGFGSVELVRFGSDYFRMHRAEVGPRGPYLAESRPTPVRIKTDGALIDSGCVGEAAQVSKDGGESNFVRHQRPRIARANGAAERQAAACKPRGLFVAAARVFQASEIVMEGGEKFLW